MRYPRKQALFPGTPTRPNRSALYGAAGCEAAHLGRAVIKRVGGAGIRRVRGERGLHARALALHLWRRRQH